MKKHRKYLSEHSVNLCSARWAMIPADQINSDNEMREEDKEHSKNHHIYLICKRPSLYFVNESFRYEGGRIIGEIAYRIEGVEHKRSFEQEFPLEDGAVRVEVTKYPHREIKTFDDNDECVRYLPASALTTGMNLHNEIDDLRNLEVLYVGQAFGGGNRTALDRLKSHSTFQKILAQTVYESPDSEIYTLTFEYPEYRVIASFDGISKGAISGGSDKKRFISIMDNPLKKGQQISIAEAALIRYFQPEYNKIYKKKFPARELRVLKPCYELDFSGLIVEIDTSELNFCLYTEAARENCHHIANIDLVDDESRASFFHTHDANGEFVRLMDSIGTLDNGS